MIGPLMVAGLVLFLFVAGWYAVWDWNRTEARMVRRAQVERWRRDRQVDFPDVRLDDSYADAIETTLVRANLVTANQLIAVLEQAREPVVLEVVG